MRTKHRLYVMGDVAGWSENPRQTIGIRSKMENQIGRHCELVLVPSVVVSLPVPSAFEAQFRTDLDGCANPVTPGNSVLRIPRCVAGALPFLVVKKIAAKRKKIMR